MKNCLRKNSYIEFTIYRLRAPARNIPQLFLYFSDIYDIPARPGLQGACNSTMTTALSAQLARIAATSTNSLDLKAQKKAHSQSLIFDSSVAATQDFDIIYQICIEGYQEICQIDARFSGFARSIFSVQSKQQERTQMTAAQNSELDEVLESFLSLVGVILQLKPALKAVEWLVRRYRCVMWETS